MSDSTTPAYEVGAFQSPADRQLREASEARIRPRLVAAAGIAPSNLSPQAQRTLAWLTGRGAPTIDSLVEILNATRTARRVVYADLPRLDAGTAVERAASLDEQEAERLGRD